MSNFLAVDTSSRYLTVIAKNGEKVVKHYLPDCALNHSVVLMDEADKVLCEAQLTCGECDFFAAVTGPGSFTGIRIGVSAVKGFALATGKKVLGVTSFELISYNVNSETDYLVAVDAAHGHYYVGGYDAKGNNTLAPSYLSEEEVAAFGLPVYGFEDLAFDRYTKLHAGDCLYRAVVCKQSEACDRIDALYVRKSQAEEGRKC